MRKALGFSVRYEGFDLVWTTSGLTESRFDPIFFQVVFNWYEDGVGSALFAVKLGSFLLGLEDVVEPADLVNVVRPVYHVSPASGQMEGRTTHQLALPAAAPLLAIRGR